LNLPEDHLEDINTLRSCKSWDMVLKVEEHHLYVFVALLFTDSEGLECIPLFIDNCGEEVPTNWSRLVSIKDDFM